jgi:hypothetical protein
MSVSPCWTACVTAVGEGVGEAMMTGVGAVVALIGLGLALTGNGQRAGVAPGTAVGAAQAADAPKAANTHIQRCIARHYTRSTAAICSPFNL